MVLIVDRRHRLTVITELSKRVEDEKLAWTRKPLPVMIINHSGDGPSHLSSPEIIK